MKNIILFIFLFCFFPFSAFSSLVASSYSPVHRLLISLYSEDNKSLIVKTSLTSCSDEEKIALSGRVTAALLSRYVPSYMIAGVNKSIVLYNMLSGEQSWKWDGSFTGEVRNIYDSITGDYIAAADGISAVLFSFGKKGLDFVLRKESPSAIAAAIPDSDNKLLFIAEQNGNITVWSFTDTLLKQRDISASINDMVYDRKRNGFLIASGKGLFFMRGDTLSLSEIKITLAGSFSKNINKVFLDPLSSRLTVVSGPQAAVYDYPSMKLLFSFSGAADARPIDSGGARFIGLQIKNYIRLYDSKKGIYTAAVNVTDKGTFFIPPDKKLPGIDASLINLISGNKSDINMYSPENFRRTCAPVAAMMGGVYSAENVSYSSPESVSISDALGVNKPFPISKPSVKDAESVNSPEKPYINGISGISSPKKPEDVIFSGGISEPSSPKVKEVKDISLSGEMASGSVPSWFAKRKSLPPYNAVSSGGDEEAAFRAARKSIKDEAVRAMIKKLISEKKTGGIKDGEVLKRFLWMVSSSAVNSLNGSIKAIDRWTSPAGAIYVYSSLNPKLMDKALEEAYNKEISRLSGMTYQEYMKIKPNTID